MKVEYDDGTYIFNVLTYFDDFMKAVTGYVNRMHERLPIQNSKTGNYDVTNSLHPELYEVMSRRATLI